LEQENAMAWFILTQLFSTLIQLVRIGQMSDQEKDLEIMILRYQLDLAERIRDKLRKGEICQIEKID
jgi:hypothetical protein